VADKKAYMRKVYSVLDKIPENIIFHHYQKMVKNANKKETAMVRILTFPTPNKEYGYYRKWYTKSEEIKFEGFTFRGIRDYEEYLTFKYGDYMELPPENQRKVHPVSDIKLIDVDLYR
jgi:lipopolysaccharide cholinephosphotransferase